MSFRLRTYHELKYEGNTFRRVSKIKKRDYLEEF